MFKNRYRFKAKQAIVEVVKGVSNSKSIHEFFDFIGKMIAGIRRSILLRRSENSTLLIAHHMSNQYLIIIYVKYILLSFDQKKKKKTHVDPQSPQNPAA